ncbi:serine/threonine protein kinase [Methylobacterium sp. DM1]|nr:MULTISPECIES: serine/threonine protein kinase [unclassified Methylobacterium]AWI87091.1 serine/threonine protein kinase [Methylobacterium sp. DM1]
MRPVTLFSVAFAGLVCAVTPVGAAPPGDKAQGPTQGHAQGQPQGQLQGQPQGQPPALPQGQPPSAAPPSQATQASRSQGQGMRAAERRRRISYAACNRESHRRKLSGGARRRFLVRCRLGYERRPASQPAPVRRP